MWNVRRQQDIFNVDKLVAELADQSIHSFMLILFIGVALKCLTILLTSGDACG